MKMKVNKLYILYINYKEYIFKFLVWAKNSNEAKKMVFDIYNNEYGDELPKDRGEISMEEIKIERRYSEKINSHVIFIDCHSNSNLSNGKFDKINKFVDNMIKIIDDFEEE